MEFSEIYREYDKQEEEKLLFRRSFEQRLSNNYLTFYERFRGFSKLGTFTLSCLFGISLFLIHLIAALFDTNNPDTVIEDFSFFLSILNAVGLFLIFTATEKFREFLVNLVQLVKDRDKETANFFLITYKEKFLGTRSLVIGMLFGLINCGLALIFGVKYLDAAQYRLLATFLFQVFTIGFIGGLTVNATMVILLLIDKIAIKDDINLTYFYPDKCAGTLVIGNILFLLSIHFIIIGIFIFIFIHNFPWISTNHSNYNYYIHALLVFWKIFPFILSAIIFFLPTKKINSILSEYKLFEQLKIRKRMNYINGLIMSIESEKESKEKLEILDGHYQKLLKIDQEISGLNTWPYNLKYRATFLGIFLPVIIGIILELSKKIISNFLSP